MLLLVVAVLFADAGVHRGRELALHRGEEVAGLEKEEKIIVAAAYLIPIFQNELPKEETPGRRIFVRVCAVLVGCLDAAWMTFGKLIIEVLVYAKNHLSLHDQRMDRVEALRLV